jgi:hypothetical protein
MRSMASPAQLVQTVSDTTGVPLPTIVDIDRKLAKAGLRSMGGRGLSAARMTALDAARLLTAVLTSAQANVSAAAVQRYAQTQADRKRSSDGFFRTLDLAELAALPARHSFIDALVAVISSAATGAVAKLIAGARDGTTPHIEVFAFTQATYGRVRISGLPNGLTANVEYLPAARPKTQGARAAADSAGDLEQSRRITERTILAVAGLLAEEGRNE